MFCRGGGQAGRLTLGASVPTPSLVPMPRGDALVRRVACFGNATLAICASGRTYILGGGGRVRMPGGDDDDDVDDDDGDADGNADENGDDNETENNEPTTLLTNMTRAAAAAEGDAVQQQQQQQQQDAAMAERAAAEASGLSRGLGRLLGARLLAEGVEDAAGCEDHMLLMQGGNARGMGYNRYRQACPNDCALRLPEPRPIPSSLFRHQRVLQLAAGGGCSFALTEARETLAACCVAVLKARLEKGDARRCAELLALATTCDAPALAPLADAAEDCVRRARRAVAERCAELGVDVDLDSAVEELRKSGAAVRSRSGSVSSVASGSSPAAALDDAQQAFIESFRNPPQQSAAGAR